MQADVTGQSKVVLTFVTNHLPISTGDKLVKVLPYSFPLISCIKLFLRIVRRMNDICVGLLNCMCQGFDSHERLAMYNLVVAMQGHNATTALRGL